MATLRYLVYFLCFSAAAGCGAQTDDARGKSDGSSGGSSAFATGSSDAFAGGANAVGDSSLALGGCGASYSSLTYPAVTMTKQAWDAATALLPGEHFIWSYSCDTGRISQDYRVQPSAGCRVTSIYNYQTNPVRVCSATNNCTGPESCTTEPLGSCHGVTEAYCTYPSFPPMRVEYCSTDGDCRTLPGGSCEPRSDTDVNFYPDGECTMPLPRCQYPVQNCDSDAECTAAPGGTCRKIIINTQCVYNKCASDADCATGSRCLCSGSYAKLLCLPVDCATDADCGPSSTCRAESGCWGLSGYHCSTPLDGCTSANDCQGWLCLFNGSSWQCSTTTCPIEE